MEKKNAITSEMPLTCSISNIKFKLQSNNKFAICVGKTTDQQQKQRMPCEHEQANSSMPWCLTRNPLLTFKFTNCRWKQNLAVVTC